MCLFIVRTYTVHTLGSPRDLNKMVFQTLSLHKFVKKKKISNNIMPSTVRISVTYKKQNLES